jgi:hypothetical protein
MTQQGEHPTIDYTRRRNSISIPLLWCGLDMRRRRRDLLTPGFQAVAQLPVVERPQVHCTCACPQVTRPGNRKKEHIRWQSQKIRS